MLAAAGVAAAATVGVDQATKLVARRSLEPGEVRELALEGTVSFGHIQNRGSSFGLVDELPAWIPAVATGVIGAGLVAINRGSSRPVLAGVGAGLVVGGGAGNVIDRVRQGHVTDFAHTTDAFGFYNAADVALNAGLIASAAALLLKAR